MELLLHIRRPVQRQILLGIPHHAATGANIQDEPVSSLRGMKCRGNPVTFDFVFAAAAG
ncbi:MAG: hypothetical protein FWG38_10425 [Defluviitaleaceae bacterium]|nr:hypothetical protein [Defluviitaleaceae bacterium]